MSKRVLMIAYHFPPGRGSTGVHRTVNFSRYLLQDHGWEPTVLTIHPRAHPETSDDTLDDIAPGIEVVRAFGLDTSRHLSLGGRYPQWLALPDRWASWRLGAVPAGLRHIRRNRPDVIWSTYPIATAHMIGQALHDRSGIPWISDFRDSMTEEYYPPGRAKWNSYREIERRAVASCSRVVFTTPSTLGMYRERYPELPEDRWAVIANGYDDEVFSAAEHAAPPRVDNGRIVLVHSGLLYRSERDPRAFFAAVKGLRDAGKVSPHDLRVILRASGDEEHHARSIRENGIEDIVFLEDPVPYRTALQEMLRADGLLLFQASNCNHQIPAKVYEYLRSRRPILALTDPKGDTAGLLQDAGCGTVVRLDSASEIAAGMGAFLEQVRAGKAVTATDAEIATHSRRARTAELAALLHQVCA